LGSSAERAFKLQKRAIRIISGKSWHHPCSPLFKELKVLILPAIYAMKLSQRTFLRLNEYPTAHQIHGLGEPVRKGPKCYSPQARECYTAYEKNVCVVPHS